MTSEHQILDELDADLVERLSSSGPAVKKAATTLAAAATAPIIIAVAATEAFGKDKALPKKIADVLNFALTLEYLEDEFYRTGVNSSNLIPAEHRAVFEQIAKHEKAHVELLRSALGSAAVKKPKFDFTAKGAFGDVFSNFETFAALSQAFEDTGVRAYKGQAGNLISAPDVLTIALQIHSVEARHAAAVRTIRGDTPWIVGMSRGSLPAATQAIYNGDGQSTQGGANLIGMMDLSKSEVSAAFDEPLSKAAVLKIVTPFLAG